VTAPTGSPSGSPTGTPSGAPSGAPSANPSGSPSGSPSGTPSASVSGLPPGSLIPDSAVKVEVTPLGTRPAGPLFRFQVKVTNLSGADTGPLRLVFTLNRKRLQLLGRVTGHLGKGHPFHDVSNLTPGQALTLPVTYRRKHGKGRPHVRVRLVKP
jgi:hypothetical protein